jgi:ABC-type Mn2+/Zn2+ transport system permease subunit
LTTRFWNGIALSVVLALAEAWFGLALAYATDWPTSFWITALSSTIYLLAVFSQLVTGVARRYWVGVVTTARG